MLTDWLKIVAKFMPLLHVLPLDIAHKDFIKSNNKSKLIHFVKVKAPIRQVLHSQSIVCFSSSTRCIELCHCYSAVPPDRHSSFHWMFRWFHFPLCELRLYLFPFVADEMSRELLSTFWDAVHAFISAQDFCHAETWLQHQKGMKACIHSAALNLLPRVQMRLKILASCFHHFSALRTF